MNCKHTKRAIKSLICGEKADVRAIQEHLTACPRCNEKDRAFLAILRSLEGLSAAQLDEDAWKEFSARLRTRISKERPTPLGRWRSVLLWAGQCRLMRFRRAFAASIAAIALVGSVLGFLPGFWSSQEQPTTVARPLVTPPFSLELPPAAADVISIFGDDGFVTGVFSGYIQPGDFFGGHELNADDIVEALDFLLS